MTYNLTAQNFWIPLGVILFCSGFPELKVRCAYNGEYYPENETYLTDKGVRVALVNKEAWNKPIGTKTATE